MRVVVESKHSLTIETRGRIMLSLAGLIIPIHAIIFYFPVQQLFDYAHEGLAWFFIVLSLLLYVVLLFLLQGPLADKILITINGSRKEVSLERRLPTSRQLVRKIPFTEIEHFEISPPENQGYCLAILQNGQKRLLFRIKNDQTFEKVRRLHEITGKKTHIVI